MTATNWIDSRGACLEQGIIIVKYFEIWSCIVPSLLLLCVIVFSDIWITALQHIDTICLASGIRKHQTCLEIPSVTHITLKFSLIQHGYHLPFSVSYHITVMGLRLLSYRKNTWLRTIYYLQIIWHENRKFQQRSWSATIQHREDMVQAGCD